MLAGFCSFRVARRLQKETVESEDKPAKSPDWEVLLLLDGSSVSNQFGNFTLRLTNKAEIVIASGKLVACDDLFLIRSR